MMLSKVVRRILGSLSFRSGPVLRKIVESLPSPTRLPVKQVAPFRLLTIAGHEQLSLMRESLLSIARTWHQYPEILVCTDGTTSATQLRQALTWWPGPLRVEDAEFFVSAAERDGHNDIVRFARGSPMGIKLAAILYSARETPTFAADTDILWFRDFSTPLLELARQPDPIVFRMSTDFTPTFHAPVVDALGPGLEGATPPNAGLLFLHGDLLKAVDLRAGIAAAAKDGNFMSEQTLFAWAATKLRVPLWSLSDIALFATDIQGLGVTFRGQTWTARHYVRIMRHLFWRDAIALRLGIRP